MSTEIRNKRLVLDDALFKSVKLQAELYRALKTGKIDYELLTALTEITAVQVELLRVIREELGT